jgi:hypothetical protein
LRLNFVVLVILILFVSACASSKETPKLEKKKKETIETFENEVKLSIDKNISWVNLMPGSNPKFHISGKISLLKSNSYNFQNAELRLVKVYQSGREIYFIKPKVIEETEDNIKHITYSTISGLSLNRDFELNKPVDFELIFYEDNEELKYRIKDIKVEEVQ